MSGRRAGPEALAARERMHDDSTDPRHGTINGYSNLGCRCQPCRDAWAAYCQRRRHQRAREEPPEHGTEWTYSNWMCRCRPCKDGHAKDMQRRRAEKRLSEMSVQRP